MAFRMTPEQKRWLDRVAAESGMSKQDFIMARLHDEAITVVPNIRAYRALRENMLELLRELSRIRAGGTVDEQLHDEVERLTKEFVDLRGEVDAATVNAERHDILEMSRGSPECLTERRDRAPHGDEEQRCKYAHPPEPETPLRRALMHLQAQCGRPMPSRTLPASRDSPWTLAGSPGTAYGRKVRTARSTDRHSTLRR